MRPKAFLPLKLKNLNSNSDKSKMNKIVIIFLSLFFLYSSLTLSMAQDTAGTSPATNSDEAEEDIVKKDLNITVGIDKLYKLDFVPHERHAVSIGNTTLLDYQIAPLKREVIFKGLRAGDTSVIIRNSAGDVKEEINVKIVSSNQSQVVSDLKEYLDDVEGLEIGVKGGKVYVGGEIVVPNDVGRVEAVLEGYKDILRLYELSPHTERTIVEKMQTEMKRFGLKDVSVRLVNKVYWIEGVVTKDSDKELATKIAEGFVLDRIEPLARRSGRLQSVGGRPIIQNFISVNEAPPKPPPPPKMIKIIAQFVELTKDYNKIFGFKWTPSLAPGGGTIQFGKTSTDGVTTKSSGTFSGTIGNLFPQLAAAKSAGHARVIQSGLIIVKDKAKTVTINKNSTIPVTIGSGEFPQMYTITTGFGLSVAASITGNDKIEMGIGVDVAMGSGPVGTTKNRIQTILMVNNKESAVVGGIALNETQTQYDKDPPFGKDQIDPNTGFPLFSFLRSKSHSISKSQFVVFVTPEIIDSPSKTTSEIKKKFRQRRR
ncbi:MAG: hypothetical protein HQK50_04305 [Oligoflexia bacterium]|nr:hypothetical protein [Oligoflexia bacterium]MBF0364767.1 hypothetical protein [Oligoflexia bacterium]